MILQQRDRPVCILLSRCSQRWIRGVCVVAALISLMASPGACRRKPPAGQVVLYVSVDEHLARQVIERFQQQTGIAVSVVGDVEAKKTTGLAERLRSEKDKPQADVFWSSEILQTIDLAEDGVLDEHLSDATADWPRTWRDGERRWFAFAARPRVVVYAPDRVPEDQRPRTWMDLTQSRWRDRLIMADPRFGTTGTHLAAMLWHWDREVMPGYFSAWAQGLAANNVRLSTNGNAGVVDAVVKGEADIGMTDADDVWSARANGLNVDLIYPLHGLPEADTATARGPGTLMIPNTVARVKGGPNAVAAKALIDFLLSEEVERMLAESVSHNIPVRESLRESFADYAIPNPMAAEWERIAPMRLKAIEQFFDGIDAVKSEREEAKEIRRQAQTTQQDADADAASEPATAPAGGERDGG